VGKSRLSAPEAVRQAKHGESKADRAHAHYTSSVTARKWRSGGPGLLRLANQVAPPISTAGEPSLSYDGSAYGCSLVGTTMTQSTPWPRRFLGEGATGIELPPLVNLCLGATLYFPRGGAEETRRKVLACIARYQAVRGVPLPWGTSGEFPWTREETPPFPAPASLLHPKRAKRWAIGYRAGADGRELTDAYVFARCSDPLGEVDRYYLDSRFPKLTPGEQAASFSFHLPVATDSASIDAFRALFLATANDLGAHAGWGGFLLYPRDSRFDVPRAERLWVPELYAAARRYPGAEIADPGGTEEVFRQVARGRVVGNVNWLTVVTPRLLDWADPIALDAADLGFDFEVHPLEDGAVCIQSGPHPRLGDTSKNDWPENYALLTQRLSPARLRESYAIYWEAPPGEPPFDADASTQWVRRFELETDRTAFLAENTTCLFERAREALKSENRALFGDVLRRLAKQPLQVPDAYSGLPRIAAAAVDRAWVDEAILALEIASARSSVERGVAAELARLRRDGATIRPRVDPLKSLFDAASTGTEVEIRAALARVDPSNPSAHKTAMLDRAARAAKERGLPGAMQAIWEVAAADTGIHYCAGFVGPCIAGLLASYVEAHDYPNAARIAEAGMRHASSNPTIFHDAARTYVALDNPARAIAMIAQARDAWDPDFESFGVDRALGPLIEVPEVRTLLAESLFDLARLPPAALVERCVDRLKKSPHAKRARPVPEHVLKTLRFADGKPLPPSLRAFFAFDLTFESWNGRPSFTKGFGDDPAHPRVVPVNLRAEARSWGSAIVGKPEAGLDFGPDDLLQEEVYDKKLTGLVYRLPHGGDQSHLLYVGMADSRGEYPVLGLDWNAHVDRQNRCEVRANVFVKYPSFDRFLLEHCFMAPDDVVRPSDLMQEILERNPELAVDEHRDR
jgi:hypothetical protein